jgi:hypothetical protein
MIERWLQIAFALGIAGGVTGLAALLLFKFFANTVGK